MNRLGIIEALRNFIDLGYFKKTLQNSIRTNFEMGKKEFLKHLLLGRGYNQLTPVQLEKKLDTDRPPLIIDLREKHKFRAAHIEDALSHPFDDFLKAVLMDGQYADHAQKGLILVCDTGHQSRVAAGILAEMGFSRVYSVHRGMHRINRWQRLKDIQYYHRFKFCRICQEFFV